tara:strand:- start:42 stop:902 length:861 start_codon:yes stop_codon:yes gene_type:complete
MATAKPKRKTVADLKTNILNPALTSTYECHFVFPKSVRDWANSRSGVGNGITLDNVSNISIACREASLPGTSLATHEMLNDFTGVRERHAYRRQYDDTASFTFYVDVNYDSIFLFENWINFIVNQDNNDTNTKNSNYSYRVNFPNEYKSRIFIRKFERDYAGRNLEYSFFDAYPLSINSMPVFYDESQVLQCTVNFCFSRYIINAPDGYTKPLSAPSPSPLPEEQKKSSKINDSYGGTAGPGTPFVRRDTATGTDLTNGRGEPAEPLLLPDGSPVRDANGNFREMF